MTKRALKTRQRVYWMLHSKKTKMIKEEQLKTTKKLGLWKGSRQTQLWTRLKRLALNICFERTYSQHFPASFSLKPKKLTCKKLNALLAILAIKFLATNLVTRLLFCNSSIPFFYENLQTCLPSYFHNLKIFD